MFELRSVFWRPWVLVLASPLAAAVAAAAADADAASPPGVPTATLYNGAALPLIGLGCSSGVRGEHVRSALQEGYRHLDTAQAERWNYHEAEVGEAILGSGVSRADIFLQTKIFPEDLGYAATKSAFPKSLARLNTSWVDSLLIHKPRCWAGACDKEPEGTWQESWKALEELYEGGLVRAIGICDVDDSLLDELLRQKHKPHIIQNWMDPFHQDRRIRARCREEGIQYQAYSTLGAQWVHFRGHRANPVHASPVIQAIAEQHNRSVAQVVLNWAVGHGAAVIPASRQASRRQANLRSLNFRLTPEQVANIDALDGSLAAAAAAAAPESVEVAFESRHSESLDVFFISDGNVEAKVGELPPGGRLGQTTYPGHRFRFKRGGRVVQDYTVASGGAGARRPVVIPAPHGEL